LIGFIFTIKKEGEGDKYEKANIYSCPISFVKAKILLENLVSGEKAILRFKGKDETKNLLKTLEEDGFKITNYLLKEKEIIEIEVLKKK